MKITKIDVYLLDAGTQSKRRRPIVCRMFTDEGMYGDGEAGIAYGIGAPAAFGMVQDLGRMLIGRDPMNIDLAWYEMMNNSSWGMGGGAIFFAAMSALNIAMMDIKGKALNVPCYQLIGGKFRSEMRTYASQLQFGWKNKTGPFGKTEDYVSITEEALKDGYDAVKIDFIWIGKDAKPTNIMDSKGILSYGFMQMVEERIKGIRDNLGYDFDLIVENHCRTGTVGAIQMGELCDKYKVFAYEETTMPLNPELHKAIREKVRTPLADGEKIFTRWGFMNFFKDHSIQLIQPDICNCGGLSEARKICDIAEVFDVFVQGHCAGTSIATSAALHLEAAIPNFCIHEHHYRSTQPDVAILCKYDYQPIKGKFTVPELPGLGQEISDYAIKTALMHDTVDSIWSED
jgi:galactonate dehydratase